MGSVNVQSLREEAERIKSEFQRIATNKKIDAEINMLIQSMLVLINLLVAIFLEKTTKKTNKNSSEPSSQTEKDESSTTNMGTNGKGK
jgi:transposase